MDPPGHNEAMVEKLDLPFALLSDAKGELAKLYDLWNAREGVAVPAILVLDRSGTVRYLYKGSDFADRPGDGPIFEALDEIPKDGDTDAGARPEVSLSADEAEADTVRPQRPAITLEQLVPYYRGVYFTTVALRKRVAGVQPGGNEAAEEVDKYQAMTSAYMEAIQETRKQKNAR